MEILNFKGPITDLIHILKKGGSIHIKKKNRGKFTESAKRAGMGVQEYARHVLANKDKYSSTLVKRANFARNAKKFKHEDGGVLFAQSGAGNWWTPQPLSPIGIALNQAKTRVKRNGTSEPLPPGVKEVVGPDGKKVAIRTEQPLIPLEQSIAEWLPGTGDVTEVGYIANDVKNGNLGTAALAAGLMVLPGNARKILDKFGVDLGDISTFARLSDQEWDDMYFQAVDSGDMDLVQTIRDAHFKVKATGASVDADGNLIKTYRGQYPKQKYEEVGLNPFSDKRNGNRTSGYFSSTSPQIADTYVQSSGDKFELYTNFTNPSVVDAGGRGYDIAVSQVTPDGHIVGIQTDAYVNKAFSQGHDGVIIKNVKDAGVGNNLNDLEKIADDYVGAAGRSKLADPITREFDIFTGDYEIIPISRRDNFNISDIRYGITPLILGLGAAKAVSNSGNTKEQQ